MSAFRPFKLLNASERERIVAHCTIAFDGWRQGWVTASGPSSSAPTCVPAADHADLAFATNWGSFKAEGATLYFAGSEHAGDLIRNSIATGAGEGSRGPSSTHDGGTIANDLVQMSLHDLAERLMGTPAARTNQTPAAALWSRGSGAARVTLTLHGGELAMLLDAALVSKIIGPTPRTSARSTALVNPQQCIGRQRVEIGVWLGSAEVELATLQTLAVNDVLMLDSRIDHPLRVTVEMHDVIPRAVLGHTGPAKAVRLTTYAPGQ